MSDHDDDLFSFDDDDDDEIGRTIPSRHGDPETSHAAEPPKVRANTQRHLILTAYATGDWTDEEAASVADASTKSCWWKRSSELRQGAYIETMRRDDGTLLTRVSSAGEAREVCKLTDKGRETLNRLGMTVKVKRRKDWWDRLTTVEQDAVKALHVAADGLELPPVTAGDIKVVLAALKRHLS